MSHPHSVFTIPLIAFCALLPLVPAAQAGISEPVIALHVKAHTSKTATICSTWAPNDLDCTEFTTAARTGGTYDIYVVGVNPNVSDDGTASVGGLRWGIDYDGEPQRGVDVFKWIYCGDGLEFPWDTWPGPRSGNTMTWYSGGPNCPHYQPGDSGGQGVAGAFYVYAYSEDVFSVAPFYGWLTDDLGKWIGWQDPYMELADCKAAPYYLDLERARGAVRFSSGGTALGFNPCSGEGEPAPYAPPPPPVPPPPPPPPTGEHSAAILLHVSIPGNHGGACTDAPSAIDSVKTSAPYGTPGTIYNVFLLATPEVPHEPVGIAGIGMGIEYSSSLKVQTWFSCGFSYPTLDWPASGSGNRVIFNGCESGEIEVAGYFEVAVYDPSYFRIVAYPPTGKAEWADCRTQYVFEDVSNARVGWISLGGAAIGQDTDGCNPVLESCAPGPARAHQTTWGKLKSKY